MKATILLFTYLLISGNIQGQETIPSDIIKTDNGDLELFFIGHGTLMITFDSKVIHIDPVSREHDYSKLPDADLILVTHEHGDHLDPAAIDEVFKEGTILIMPQKCSDNLKKSYGEIVMGNGDKATFLGMEIEAVPAYNIEHTRASGDAYHPRGSGNGYVLNAGGKRIYIGGDTENVPEVKELKDIDIAFLPMNLPYTMTPKMVADAAVSMKPGILYPYHYGRTDPQELIDLLKHHPEIEVRIREME